MDLPGLAASRTASLLLNNPVRELLIPFVMWSRPVKCRPYSACRLKTINHYPHYGIAEPAGPDYNMKTAYERMYKCACPRLNFHQSDERIFACHYIRSA